MRDPSEIMHNGKTLAAWLEINKTKDADLRCANLRDANLCGADLSDADLRYADLRGADLRCAYLRDADLRDADLSGADLRYAVGTFSVFSGGRHQGIATCSHIVIGCKRFAHSEWRENFASIGKENDYSDEEIGRYRDWIFSLDWLIKAAKEGEK